jgi:lipopolysaccharide transport system ATP-binding protein
MNDPVIRVENLGKLYRIGSARERNKTLREAITDVVTMPWRYMKTSFREPLVPNEESDDHIWALRNVSFEVKRGEVVGIIGRNGAGKSTLLKILSRITEPTEGRVVMRGRVGSLLEVGTGFHSELTGEENIYLSGIILGMRSNEISRKFDEIVAFAEVEKFIHTPVKHYSSGMYMRLAFAVAAHLETEILMVDEVLAVGDAAFQKKCLGKMEDVANEGRTVLFVSHNMAVVRTLCSLAVLLKSGKKQMIGPVQKVISEYEHLESTSAGSEWTDADESDSGKVAKLKKIEIVDRNNLRKEIFWSSEEILLKFTVEIYKPDENLKIGFDLTRGGMIVFRSEHVDTSLPLPPLSKGKHILVCIIPPDMLMEGDYFVTPILSIHLKEWILKDSPSLVRFKVVFDTSRSFFHLLITEKNHPGIIFPRLEWKQ